jgi:hypothetical protein
VRPKKRQDVVCVNVEQAIPGLGDFVDDLEAMMERLLCSVEKSWGLDMIIGRDQFASVDTSKIEDRHVVVFGMLACISCRVGPRLTLITARDSFAS